MGHNLEADGQTSIESKMVPGSICSSDGATRLAMRSLCGGARELAVVVEYSIRPRNEVPDSRWIVPDGVHILRH